MRYYTKMARSVNSGLRAEHAALTKTRILDAARRMFEQRGYGRARIEDIAAEAGVAVPTVYKGFTNKRTLLAGVVDRSMTGADSAGPIDQQAWWQEQLREPDPRRQLRLVARNARRIYERAGTVLEVVRSSAALDGEIATIWRDVSEQRLARSRRTARRLLGGAAEGARFGATETTMTLWSLTGPELYTAHIAAGRTPDQYERWLGDLLESSLLV
jgi:AcrR family transcriptional regulator